MIDESTGKAGLIDISGQDTPEPLYLPKGSIRAIVTILVSVSCWILVFWKRDVPSYLLSLLLTVIAYYFGFRKKVKSAEGRIYDTSARPERPLGLPSGLIRILLSIGFAAAAFWLLLRGKLADLKYLEFIIILGGLILGHFFSRIIVPVKRRSLRLWVNHGKGLLVLIAAIWLSVSLFGETHNQYIELSLAALISFYFGSRS